MLSIAFLLFVSPRDTQAPLHPVVLDGEASQYVDGVSAEAQQMYSMNPLVKAKLLGAATSVSTPTNDEVATEVATEMAARAVSSV